MPCVWVKALQRATQATPPPAPCGVWIWRFHLWRNAKLSRQTPKWVPRMRRATGGGGECGTPLFKQFNNKAILQDAYFYTKMCITYPLLTAVSKFAFYVLSQEKIWLIKWTEPTYRRQIWSPGLTPFYRHISAEDSVHKNKVGYNNTHGIESSLLFFPLNLLLHKVYISNILCGLRWWVQDVYSKGSLLIAMFISTSNEHIVIRTVQRLS
jgi:hypothetical protein